MHSFLTVSTTRFSRIFSSPKTWNYLFSKRSALKGPSMSVWMTSASCLELLPPLPYDATLATCTLCKLSTSFQRGPLHPLFRCVLSSRSVCYRWINIPQHVVSSFQNQSSSVHGIPGACCALLSFRLDTSRVMVHHYDVRCNSYLFLSRRTLRVITWAHYATRYPCCSQYILLQLNSLVYPAVPISDQ